MTQANEIRKLLIVDDSRVTRMMLRALVPAKPVTVKSVAQALEFFESRT